MKRKIAATETTQKKKKARPKKDVQCMPVYGNKVYFNHYLLNQIGATWQQVKNSLYDAGYTCLEVNEYRNGLLEDFRAVCEENHLHGII